MNARFTQKAQEALNAAQTAAGEMGHSYIGSEHLALGLLSVSGSIATRILTKRGANADKLRSDILRLAGSGSAGHVSASDMTPRLRQMIENAATEALKSGQNYVGTEHLLLALCAERESMAVKLLEAEEVPLAEIRNDLHVFLGSADDFRKPTANAASSKPGASALSAYSRDLTAAAGRGLCDPVIGRERETERVIQILSRRTKNNPCLIGEPGVGKTAVVEGLASKIATGHVPETLTGKKILSLDLAAMIAGAKYRGEFEERFKNVMEEVRTDRSVILFIDEIHTVIGAGAAEGAVDAANIMKPSLARGEMQVIGATTREEYRRHIEKDAALERRFQPVTIGEPTPQETLCILRGLRQKLETHHSLSLADEALEAAVTLSRRYLHDRYLPDKAIDLLDEAASRLRMKLSTAPSRLREKEETCKSLASQKEAAIVAQHFEEAAALRDKEKQALADRDREKAAWENAQKKENRCVRAEDVAAVVTLWTGIPAGEIERSESERLLQLEELLRARVIGQDHAVHAVALAIKRGRTGLKNPNRPIGSFIFLGQSGVGKTELSRALATVLFGSEGAFLRFDMSEYMEKHSVSKLIGSPPGYVGYEEGGMLTGKVRARPYSLILFDEIEKAHPDVFNLLLAVLEDGILTDSQGRQVDFRNTVIIMTSNLGAAESRNSGMGFLAGVQTGNGQTASAEEARAQAAAEAKMKQALRAAFRPEFLNRVDDIIVFHSLRREDLRQITALLLAELTERLQASGLVFVCQESAVELLISAGWDPAYGARPLRRAIIHLLENPISEALLAGRYPHGSTVTAYAEGGEIHLK